MSKKIIETALIQAITNRNLFGVTLYNGQNEQRENAFTSAMAPLIPCFPQVNTIKDKIIDLVKIDAKVKPNKITKALLPKVEWALEAKHYSPHQPNYIQMSLEGPINDLLKLTTCRFSKFYILQLQTEVVDFTISRDFTYAQFIRELPFFSYLSDATEQQARTNILRVGIGPNYKIDELVQASKLKLDSNLIYNFLSNSIEAEAGTVDVKIHYLISGPFNCNSIINNVHIASGENE